MRVFAIDPTAPSQSAPGQPGEQDTGDATATADAGAQPPSVAIIGAGLSGTLVAVQLLRTAAGPLSITLVEPADHLGRGVAYASALPVHLLNVRADNMGAFADDPAHFLRWLREGPARQTDAAPEAFVPRAMYAAYLRATLSEAVAQAAPGVGLRWVHAAATGVTPQGPRLRIHLDSHPDICADQAVLALGNPAPCDRSAPPQQPPRRVRSGYTWSTCVTQDIGPDDPVLLLGTGLTTVDAVLALHAQGHFAPIYAVSRHGLLPQPHRPRAGYPNFLADEPPITSLRALLRRVRAEVRAAERRGVGWRDVLDSLRPLTQQLWRALPLEERRRFLRHLRPYWDVHRHRIAPSVAETFETLVRSGQLSVRAGFIERCAEEAGGVDVAVRLRGSQTREHLRVAYVINCTGPACDYGTLADPLIVSLRGQGLLRPDALRQGIDATADGQLLGADGQPSPWLSTLGPPHKGVLWECTAVPDIRVQAAALTRRLLATLCPA
jgi:uncharacterized NAD(P)/FAD-binding protein YdhS